MKIIRQTKVKQVLTETSKEKLQYHFENEISAKRKEIDQLVFEKKKLLKQQFDSQKVEAKFAKEELKRQQSIEWYEFQLEQLKQLPLGSEITEREVEEIVEVSIGDNWEELMGAREIVVQDGKIVKINR
ncbi:YlqD family protein [Alkalibacillus salilacus]|uniref:YlqD protein n=1 Tax=Alkalibacillus salilacus TaxID=284582 RepID=A0ABT9VDR5_9BACI|nr:YlqD family protein [Alkalibacillus salilacus]MDQ0159116.1 hypothetical protein [Alkalibacillus salilacus]